MGAKQNHPSPGEAIDLSFMSARNAHHPSLMPSVLSKKLSDKEQPPKNFLHHQCRKGLIQNMTQQIDPADRPMNTAANPVRFFGQASDPKISSSVSDGVKSITSAVARSSGGKNSCHRTCGT